MSARVIHHAGTLCDLRALLRNNREAMKARIAEANADWADWKTNKQLQIPRESIDTVIDRQKFDDPQAASILSILITNSFPPASNDWKIEAYRDFHNIAMESELKFTIASMVSGSGFFASKRTHKAVLGCGYMGLHKVVAANIRLARYVDHSHEWVREFVIELRETFARIIDAGTGDLYVVE